MQIKIEGRAQSIMEYVVLLGVIAAALTAMQIYFKRGIQAVVKVAADEMGEQKKGGIEYDYRYEWKERLGADTATVTNGTQRTDTFEGGAVTHAKTENTIQSGTLFKGQQKEKE